MSEKSDSIRHAARVLAAAGVAASHVLRSAPRVIRSLSHVALVASVFGCGSSERNNSAPSAESVPSSTGPAALNTSADSASNGRPPQPGLSQRVDDPRSRDTHAPADATHEKAPHDSAAPPFTLADSAGQQSDPNKPQADETAERLRSFQELGGQSNEPTPKEIRPDADAETLAALGIRRVDGRHLILLTDLPANPAIDELPRVFDLAVPEWCRYFEVPEDRAAEWKLVGHLMQDKDVFQRAGLLPDWLPPFRNGYQRGHRLWLYEQPEDFYRRHLLLHEGTHGFMVQFVGGGGPPWYSEGVAELLGTHEWTGDRLRLGVFPADKTATPGWGRIRIMQDEFRGNRAMSLGEILQYDTRAHLKNEPYGWCWGACAFLDAHPRYETAFQELKKNAPDTSLQFSARFREALANEWPLLNHEWHWFAANVDYGYDVTREAIDPVDAQPLGAAGAEVSVMAARGWQSSGWTLEPGRAYAISASGRFQINNDQGIWLSEAGGVTIQYHNGRPRGMLIAAVVDDKRPPSGLSPLVRPIAIGPRATLRPESPGTLYLRVNDSPDSLINNAGELTVRISPPAP